MNRSEIFNKLSLYLSDHHLKSTKQRDAIIEAFIKLKHKHVSIEEILKESRKINKNIGYATVYRTLMLLVDAEIAQQRHFAEGQSLFELTSDEHHDHLICNQCGKITEFENDTIENLQEKISEKFGFLLKSHRMILYGNCLEKQQTGHCPYFKK